MLGIFIFVFIYILFPLTVVALFLKRFKFIKRIVLSALILICSFLIAKGINWIIDLIIKPFTLIINEFSITLLFTNVFLPAFVYFYFICIISPYLADSINKNNNMNLKNIFKDMRRVFLTFIYILSLFAFMVVLEIFMSYNLKFSTEEEKNKIVERMELEFCETVEPIYISHNVFQEESYVMKFNISKEEYEKNQLDYSESKTDKVDYNAHTRLNNDTYRCIISASEYDKNKEVFIILCDIYALSFKSNCRVHLLVYFLVLVETIFFAIIMKKFKKQNVELDSLKYKE